MTQYLITIDQFKSALNQVLEELERQSGTPIKDIELSELIHSALVTLKSEIMDFKLKKIVLYSIDEILDNWHSLESLMPEETISLHCRKILESSVIVRSLLDSPQDWDKYIKKWELYPEVTVYSRWSKMDHSDLHPETKAHIAQMSARYKSKYQDFEVFQSKNRKVELSGDLIQDLPIFKGIKSWLSPRSFDDVLKQDPESNVPEMYYTWWSNSIHFSPLNQTHKKIMTEFGTFSENSYLFTMLELSTFIRSVSHYSKNADKFQALARSFFHKHLLKSVNKDPEGFVKFIETHPQIFVALNALAVRKISPVKFLELTTKEKAQKK